MGMTLQMCGVFIDLFSSFQFKINGIVGFE